MQSSYELYIAMNYNIYYISLYRYSIMQLVIRVARSNLLPLHALSLAAQIHASWTSVYCAFEICHVPGSVHGLQHACMMVGRGVGNSSTAGLVLWVDLLMHCHSLLKYM